MSAGTGTLTNTLTLSGDIEFEFDLLRNFFNQTSLSGSGAVKLVSNGDTTKPTYSLAVGVPQQITYTAPLLDSQSYFPQMFVKDSTSIYNETNDIFLENKILGQPQYWNKGPF